MSEQAARRGVYFLANDRIRDITMAFLNSFRVHNPDLPLCLIPFDDTFGQIAALAGIYDFSIYGNVERLKQCDEMALCLSGQPCGAYRKFCAFDGPFEESIYIDCDTLVLQDVAFFFSHLKNFDWIFTHSDLPLLKQFVWKDTIDKTGLLNPEQIAFSANTGCFCSHRAAFDFDKAMAELPELAERVAPHMDFQFMEQPYMNYWVVTSGVRYTSLHRLTVETNNWNAPREQWAGEKAWVRRNVFLLHYAGSWRPTAADEEYYRRLARFGIKVRSPGVRRALPHKRLWKRYRYLHHAKRAAGE